MNPPARALFLAALPASGPAAARPLAEGYAGLGTMIVTSSPFTMFPHGKRAKGHPYEGKSYPADLHDFAKFRVAGQLAARPLPRR